MPMPKPSDGESHDDFIERCMSDDVMIAEYDDNDQRLAVCQTQWDNTRANAARMPADAAPSPELERRVMPLADADLRVRRDADGKPTQLAGYAAVFNKMSVDLGWFIEKIEPGAFKDALKDSDVRALFNHNPDVILGRSTAGTLRMSEDKRGLAFVVDLPDTQAARDVAESVDRGDVDGCSFAFTVKKEQWEESEEKGKQDIRTVIEVGELFDVGPVVYPAYPDTTVAARSMQAAVLARDATAADELSTATAIAQQFAPGVEHEYPSVAERKAQLKAVKEKQLADEIEAMIQKHIP